MRFQKVKLSTDASNRFRLLKGNTGLTPNILCRFAFAYSIEDPTPVIPDAYDTDGQELNRPTLTGDHDDIMVGLLKERCHRDGIDLTDDAALLEHLVAHINRGVIAMSSAIKNIEDLALIAPRT